MNKVSLNNWTELNMPVHIFMSLCMQQKRQALLPLNSSLFFFSSQASLKSTALCNRQGIHWALSGPQTALSDRTPVNLSAIPSTCHPGVWDLLPWLTSTLFPANPCAVSKHRHPSHDHPGCMQSKSTYITFHPSLNQRTPTHTETLPSQSRWWRKANRMRLGGTKGWGEGLGENQYGLKRSSDYGGIENQ